MFCLYIFKSVLFVLNNNDTDPNFRHCLSEIVLKQNVAPVCIYHVSIGLKNLRNMLAKELFLACLFFGTCGQSKLFLVYDKTELSKIQYLSDNFVLLKQSKGSPPLELNISL